MDQHTGGEWLFHRANTVRTTSHKNLNNPVEYSGLGVKTIQGVPQQQFHSELIPHLCIKIKCASMASTIKSRKYIYNNMKTKASSTNNDEQNNSTDSARTVLN